MGFLSALFGGSDQKSSSSNKAFPFLQGALSPAVSAGTGAVSTLSDNLGSFADYKKNAGFDNALNYGADAITGNAAAQGLLRSGSTKKSLGNMITSLTGQYYDNFLNHVGQLGQLGLGAAGTLAGAGQESHGSGSSTGGIIPGLAQLFSDERVKTDIVPVGLLENGLTIYTFRYIGMPQVHMGLIAQEVAQIHPEAVHEVTWNGVGPLRGKPVLAVDYARAVQPVQQKVA